MNPFDNLITTSDYVLYAVILLVCLTASYLLRRMDRRLAEHARGQRVVTGAPLTAAIRASYDDLPYRTTAR